MHSTLRSPIAPLRTSASASASWRWALAISSSRSCPSQTGTTMSPTTHAPRPLPRRGRHLRERRHLPLNVDDDWIVEHATQVSRMLPGGLAVVGVYAFCSDASWRGSAPR